MKTKILKITGITLLLLISFVWSAPWLFRGMIARQIKAQINKDIIAHVDFSGANISLFRRFPKVAIGLQNLQVICVGEFQGDTILNAKEFELSCDFKTLITGHGISVSSISVNDPRVYAHVHADGHSNWNSIKRDGPVEDQLDSSKNSLRLDLKQYAIHNGYLDYQDERRNTKVEVFKLEQEGTGNFSADSFSLKTKTTADEIHLNHEGNIPYQLTAKSSVEVTIHVDNKTHTYSFNTDRISLNDLKLHTEGFFQWINDSSYNMSIRYKLPSTKFKDFLSMLPSVYQNDFTHVEANGQVNFNGFIKGKYDKEHFPAYHTNLYVTNGYFKYPDLPVPVEHLHFGIQIDNPDGISDHKKINISEAHAEIYHDTLDMHLLVKNPESIPYIDFALVGKLDLANLAQCIKLEAGTKWSGFFIADVHAKGNIAETGKKKKDAFTSRGEFDLSDFAFTSPAYPRGIAVSELIMAFNSKNIQIQEWKAAYLKTHMEGTGTVNNLFAFALNNKPLKGTLDLKADELNLRDWMKADVSGNATAQRTTIVVPDNIDFSITAEAAKFHYDNLDLQNLSGKMQIADQKIQFENLKANGLDGELAMEGMYSTSETPEKPEIAFTYDVKGMDIQKTFLAFNTLRKIMPVAKFMAGSFNAHMTLNGRLNNDMTTDLATLQGEGSVQLLAASLKDFGPMDKLSKSLDIAALKCMLLTAVHADFSYKAGKVDVSPFLVHAKDIDLGIGGVHGFDQTLDYHVYLNVPRTELGSKGNMFVKNVVTEAAEKGIPVQLKDAVPLNVKMGGTINSPEVKTDMDAEVNTESDDLKKEVDAFVNAKLDSAKRQLHHALASRKKPLYLQTSYHSKTKVKAKKNSKSTHKQSTQSKSKKKKKKPSGNYITSLKKEKSTASNNR